LPSTLASGPTRRIQTQPDGGPDEAACLAWFCFFLVEGRSQDDYC
jgi:hypothetical protein